MARYSDERAVAPEAVSQLRAAEDSLQALDASIALYAEVEARLYHIKRAAYEGRRSDPAIEAA